MRNCSVFGLALSSALFSITVARAADVTIVSTATSSGTIPGQGDRGGSSSNVKPEAATTTIYFQGHKVRIESEHSIVLYDGNTKTRYMINAANKTYTVGSNIAGAMPGLAKMLDIKTTVSVVPTGKTRVIVGQNAKEYDYNETVSLSFKTGAFSQGVASAPKKAVAPIPVMVVKVQGQQWVGAVPGLPSNSADVMLESSGLSQLTQIIPGLKALGDELKGVKGYPLASHQSVTMTGMGIASVTGKSRAQVGVDTVATAIRQTPLAKSLFEIPSGYTRVEAKSPLPGNPLGGRPGLAP